MAINFNELPDSNPNTLLDKGQYRMIIEKAEMKQPKDPQKPPYLNVELQVYSNTGEKLNKVWDIVSEPNTDVTRFKLKRFVRALQIPLKTFELKDLTKIAAGKEIWADVTTQVGTGSFPDKNVIDVFSKDIYYTPEDIKDVDDYFPDPAENPEPEPEFTAEDAADAPQAETETKGTTY